eukprot:TRINITY_DN14868_c0_g1_i1.p1 TRINITY_DN14868_c0_g1~~TRINITY_DN14868_c0_g1_i1.p1  ORF type:complete len:495 (+),score=87.73 TRINITY_DN14868_c0_g1_i1:35-1486(+)
MSITVFVRTPSEVHAVDITGSETMQCLYDKAAKATGAAGNAFLLKYEEVTLQRDDSSQIQSTDLMDGCEVTQYRKREYRAPVEDFADRNKLTQILQCLNEDPGLFAIADVPSKEVLVLRTAINVREICVADPSNKVTTIGEYFMSPRPENFHGRPVGSIISFDIPGATVASFCFCRKLTNLSAVDLTGLPCLTTVASDFLTDCPQLTSVYLPPSLKEIGENFLSHNPLLKYVDLTPLSNVVHIGSGFLSHTGLTTVDLSPLSGVLSRKVSMNFLSHCGSLSAVDLSPLKGVVTIGDRFLSEAGVTSLDLSPLDGVRSIGDFFLSGTKISSLDLAPLSAIRHRSLDGTLSMRVGNNFLSNCGLLTHLDLAPLKGVVAVGDQFLAKTGISSLDITGLQGVLSIGKNFLAGTGIISIDLSPLSGTKSIGGSFLAGTPITSINVNPLQHLDSVGADFLKGCDSLGAVDLSPLRGVRKEGRPKTCCIA